MGELRVVRVEANVMRVQFLGDPHRWAWGDYTKFYSDGTQADASYDEYSASIGLPPDKNQELIVDDD